jgi:hypothetical protein
MRHLLPFAGLLALVTLLPPKALAEVPSTTARAPSSSFVSVNAERLEALFSELDLARPALRTAAACTRRATSRGPARRS